MSAGMTVQEAVQESPQKAATESVLKAKQGNQIPGSPSYEQTSASAAGSDPVPAPPELTLPMATEYDYVNGIFSPGVGSGAAYAVAKAAAGPPSGWGTIPASSGFAFNGWSIGNWGAWSVQFHVYYGLAKNTTGFPKPYFLAHLRSASSDAHSPQVVSGITTFIYELSIISTGIIQPNQVIGAGMDIELPFPSPDAWPLNKEENAAILVDFIFAVIDQDPGTGVDGFNLGRFTYVT